MQTDIEQFLSVLEAERGFSVNTIFAYRNDLTQFLGFLTSDAAARSPGEESDEAGAVDLMALPAVATWTDLSDQHLTSYMLHLRGRQYGATTA